MQDSECLQNGHFKNAFLFMTRVISLARSSVYKNPRTHIITLTDFFYRICFVFQISAITISLHTKKIAHVSNELKRYMLIDKTGFYKKV